MLDVILEFIFRAHHYPEIEIRLVTTDRNADIGSNKYDLIIAVDDAKDADQMPILPLFPERLGPVLAPSLAAKFKLRCPKDLVGSMFSSMSKMLHELAFSGIFLCVSIKQCIEIIFFGDH